MQAEGYVTVPGDPWETASGGKAVVCKQAACTLTAMLDKPAGPYNIAVQYYDFRGAASKFELVLNGKVIGQWLADATLPPAANDRQLDGSTSTRFTLASPVQLKPGDTLALRGIPDGDEPAPVDYVEITPAGTPKQ